MPFCPNWSLGGISREITAAEVTSYDDRAHTIARAAARWLRTERSRLALTGRAPHWVSQAGTYASPQPSSITSRPDTSSRTRDRPVR